MTHARLPVWQAALAIGGLSLMSWAVIMALAMALAGCTTTQVATVQGYQDQLVSACSLALPLAVVPMVGVYITAGCATEEGIAKLALDPSKLARGKRLVGKAKGAKTAE